MPETTPVVLIGTLIEQPELDRGEEQEPVVYIKLNCLDAPHNVMLRSALAWLRRLLGPSSTGYHKVVVTDLDLRIRILRVRIPRYAVLMIQGQQVPDMWSPGVPGIVATDLCLYHPETDEIQSLDSLYCHLHSDLYDEADC